MDSPQRADRLRYLVHEGVWTTSNELYGELFVALKMIRRKPPHLPRDIDAEIGRLIKRINHICRWR